MSLPLWERVRVAWRDRDTAALDDLERALRSPEGAGLPPPVQNAIQAQLHLIAGDDKAARRLLIGTSKQRPLEPHEKLILGFILIEDVETSGKLFSAVLSAKIRDPRIPEGLGQVAGRAGRFDEAVRHLSQAVKIDPKNWSAHYALGLALMDLKRPDEARKAFETAVKLRPDFELAWLAYAQAAIASGEAVAASKVLGPIAKEANREALTLAYVDCLVHAGDLRKALAAMTPVADVSQDPRLLLDYVELCLTGEFLEPAEKVLGKVESLDPKQARLWFYRGQLAELAAVKDVPAALAAYDKAVTLGEPRARNALALLLMRPTDHTDFTRADKLLTEAARATDTPAGWAALSNLALLRRQQNRDAEAVQTARQVLEVAPANSKAYQQAQKLVAELGK